MVLLIPFFKVAIKSSRRHPSSAKYTWNSFLNVSIRNVTMQRRLVVTISIAYFAAFLGVGIVIASLGPVMLALSAQTGAEVDDLAFLFTSRAVGYLLGSIVGGALVDKIPGHRLMFAGLIANSVATAMFPLLKSIPLLALLSSVQGLTMGFLDTGMPLPAVVIALLPTLTLHSHQRAFALVAWRQKRALDASYALLFWNWRFGIASFCARVAKPHVVISHCLLDIFSDFVSFRGFFPVFAQSQSSSGLSAREHRRKLRVYFHVTPNAARRVVPAVPCRSLARCVRGQRGVVWRLRACVLAPALGLGRGLFFCL